MTEEELLKYIKTTKQFPRSFDDYFNYFFPALFISISGVQAYAIFKTYGQSTFNPFFILLFCLGVLLAFLTLIRLNDNVKFKAVRVDSKIDIDKIADGLKEKFKLKRIRVDKDLGKIEAFTQIRSFSWGEKLTLIWTDNSVLINSRPNGFFQPFTFFEDRKNIRELEQLLTGNTAVVDPQNSANS
jgi:hypothetical protein